MSYVSLWKQCRALACPVRLSILHLLTLKSGQYVKEIAGQLDLAEDVASKNLQLLESAGLLASERRGKYHYYRLNSEDPLLRMVIEWLGRKMDSDRMIYMLTALTHERRVGIVALLRAGTAEVSQLCRDLKMSRRAAERHLDKLVRRGWLRMEEDLCMVSSPKDDFGKALLRCVEAGGTPAQVCQKEEDR
jgi:DNA-binding transcriptional ArsR family regulator